ncbi:hypothetical protein D3C79_549100 [compost metagenome]
MEIDNYVCERFDTTSFWAEDEDGLPVVHQPPSCRKTEFPLILWKRLLSSSNWWHHSREKALHPWAFFADTQIQARIGGRPNHLTKPQSGWAPVMFYQVSRMVPTQPSGEVVELVTVRENC